MSTENKKLRVLLAHGLDGSPEGWKSDILKSKYIYECPNMRDIIDRHRSIKSNHVIAALVAMVAGSVSISSFLGYLLFKSRNVAYGFAIGLVGFCTWKLYRFFYRKLVLQLYKKCMDLQEEAIKRFKPDVVIGSSFGGGIIVLLAMRGIWTGRTILLAPAQKKMLQIVGEETSVLSISNLEKCCIIHGTKDDIIDIEDSSELSLTGKEGKVEYVIVDDDHNLQNYLQRKGKLIEHVEKIARD